MSFERRRWVRTDRAFFTRIRQPHQQMRNAKVRNLSAHGCMIECSCEIEIGMFIEVRFPGYRWIAGTVVWVLAPRAGVAFFEPQEDLSEKDSVPLQRASDDQACGSWLPSRGQFAICSLFAWRRDSLRERRRGV